MRYYVNRKDTMGSGVRKSMRKNSDEKSNIINPPREENPTAECIVSSSYLIAQNDQERDRQKELLYRVLGPVFFGEKRAASEEELRALFRERYGIDVDEDFYEGDEHYEEYLEAQQAISEGMSIYGGEIEFEDKALANLAEDIWEKLETMDRERFRRINTLLEE